MKVSTYTGLYYYMETKTKGDDLHQLVMSKTKVTKINEVKLNDLMNEFDFKFWKTEEKFSDLYVFNLPNRINYIVFIDDNKLRFDMVNENQDILYSESFKSIKSLRNRLCDAI